jgi:nucleotide-binding universal stress UspA family protein
MNRIVIGVDGSPAATAGARWAACEAAMRNVELTVVHVLQSPEVWLQTGWPAIPLPAEVGEDQLAQGEKILEDALAVIAKTPGPCQPARITTRLCVGGVVPTLSGCSHKESHMIVVGRRGRGGCIVLCSAQSAAACCTVRTARSRWSTTACHRFHRATDRLSWALTARQAPSQPRRSPSMKPRDVAWT